jgi:outer membrane protein
MQKLLTAALLLGTGLIVGLDAQESPNMVSRPMSLNDCIQLALEKNLTLKVERINPEISQANLRIAYAGYDPSFNTSFNHNFRQQPGNVDEFNRVIPGTSSETDSISSGLSGQLPTGLGYNISGNVSDTAFESTFIDPVTGLPLTAGSENSNGSVSVNMSQPLLRGLLIDQTRLNIKLSKNDLAFAKLGLVWQIMNTVSQVEQAYYDLIAANENVKVQEKAVQLAERLLTENRKRVEVGAMAPLDEKQAESQYASARASLLQTQGNLARSQNILKNLLSDEYLEWKDSQVDATEVLRALPIPFNRQDSWHKAMTLRPDLQQRRLDLERQGVLVKFNRSQVLPQLDVVGSFGYSAGGRGIGYSGVLGQVERQENPLWSVGGRFSMPIGNRVARNNFKISKARKNQSILNLKQFEQNVMVAVENAVTSAHINLQRVDATRQQREFAEAALNAEEKKLENGKSTSFFVLQLQRDLTQAASQEIQSLTDYNKSVSNLSLLEGGTLQSREISLEVE